MVSLPAVSGHAAAADTGTDTGTGTGTGGAVSSCSRAGSGSGSAAAGGSGNGAVFPQRLSAALYKQEPEHPRSGADRRLSGGPTQAQAHTAGATLALAPPAAPRASAAAAAVT